METLEKVDYKVSFRVRNAKVKVFRSVKPDDDLDLIDAADELVEEMKITAQRGLSNPPPASRSC